MTCLISYHPVRAGTIIPIPSFGDKSSTLEPSRPIYLLGFFTARGYRYWVMDIAIGMKNRKGSVGRTLADMCENFGFWDELIC